MSWFSLARQPLKINHRLAASALLCNLSERELKIVEAFVHDRQFLAGEVVFDAGEEGQALYIIVSGAVEVCLPDQYETPVAALKSGDFFGELGLLDDVPRSAQIRASERSELAVLFRGDFERLMASHAQIASKIALQLARHLGLRLRQMLVQTADSVALQ
ncbi:MAG: cyclic nucleotide-binding domain-containing protein [Rhodocyclaceae bacterium]|nr:cyclic nucleotide-binding domain-containing protein [Rhodocyclaceae bacterium]